MKRSGPAAVLFPLPTQEELAAMSEGEALNYLGEELASPVFVEKLLEDEAVNNAAALLYQDPGSLDFADEAAVVDFLQALLPDIIPAGALASRQAFDDPFAAGTPLQNILDAAGISL